MKEKTFTENEIFDTFKIIPVVLLAFAGAFFLMPDVGLVGTLFIAIACAFVSAFIKINFALRTLVFGGVALALSAVYSSDPSDAVLTGILYAVLSAVAYFSVWLFKKKKTVTVIAAVSLVILSVLIHMYFMGNPVSAFNAKHEIENYVSEIYEENADIKTSDIYFDRKSRLFVKEIYSEVSPDTVYKISYNGYYVSDSFFDYTEKLLMETERDYIVFVLRKYFPDDKFSVIGVGINGYPDGKISVMNSNNYDALCRFDIVIPSDISDDEFEKRAVSYYEVLKSEKISARQIRFTGGKADNIYRQISLVISNIPQKTAPQYIAPTLCEKKTYETFMNIMEKAGN